MIDKSTLFSYPEQRALEDSAHARDAWPTRIYAVLLPVWSVTVQADIVDADDYELIDKFLERGLAETGLSTTVELAEFLALDETHVDRALRFLTAIGHVRGAGGSWSLTDLGLRSVRDQKRYVVTREDRRKLYFDGFGSQPMPRAYYDSRKITLLTFEELQAVVNTRGGPKFHPFPGLPFRQHALTELETRQDRDRFNLPERIDNPRSLDETLTYLPLHLIRTVSHQGQVRWLAYGQPSERADDHLSSLFEQMPSILATLEADQLDAWRSGKDEQQVKDWLRKQRLEQHRPERLRNGSWRVTLPASAFGTDKPLSLSKLGSFVVQSNSFFHVWCTDEAVRRRAIFERIRSYVGSRSRVDRTGLDRHIALVGRQLEFGDVDLAQLQEMARKAGEQQLAERLGRFK